MLDIYVYTYMPAELGFICKRFVGTTITVMQRGNKIYETSTESIQDVIGMLREVNLRFLNEWTWKYFTRFIFAGIFKI
jgi:hypothetical protein